MLKFEAAARVGDLIKAFDFRPCELNDDSYVVGVVSDKGWIRNEYKGYTIDVVYDTEKRSRVGMKVYVPFETLMDYDNRVTKV